MRSLAITFVLLLGTSACDSSFGPGPEDFSAPIVHGYSIHRCSAHQIFVAPGSFAAETPIIPQKIIELDHDTTWVIAKRQHLRRRSPNNPSDTYEEPDPGVFSYWVLRLDMPQVWGPLSADEFEAKRKELAVPRSLRLHDVYDYQK